MDRVEYKRPNRLMDSKILFPGHLAKRLKLLTVNQVITGSIPVVSAVPLRHKFDSMKYALIIIAILLALALSGNAQAPSDKSFHSHGDCHNPPGRAREICLAVYYIEGQGTCSFMLLDGGRYNHAISLIGCK